MIWLRGALLALGALAALLTLLPLLPSNEWWVRIWDFPRLQIAAALLVALLLSPMLLPLRRLPTMGFIALLVLALGWQAHLIWPYSPFAPVQAAAIDHCEPESRLRLLTVNVEVSNRNAAPLLALVRDRAPDLVLLIETDDWWENQLEPLDAEFAHRVAHIQGEGYGMTLFSQLSLVDPEVRFLLDDYVPSIKTGVELRSGAEITLFGVHPKPPPLQDTEQRDAELLVIAREMRTGVADSLVAGDLNDVGWSRTTRLFLEVSGAVDPRIGRGPFATFNADWPVFLRWPLDYVFLEPDFLLREIALLQHIGSDHLPLMIELCHSGGASIPARQEAAPTPAEQQRATEIIREGREEADD